MTALLKVTEKMVGRADRRDFSVRLVSERVRARDVIAAHVAQEVDRQNAARQCAQAGRDQKASFLLGVPSHPVQAQLNKLAPPRILRPLDAAVEVEAAIRAFEARSIIMLFDDRQIEDLDDYVTVTDSSTAAFLRIVPLVGG